MKQGICRPRLQSFHLCTTSIDIDFLLTFFKYVIFADMGLVPHDLSASWNNAHIV